MKKQLIGISVGLLAFAGVALAVPAPKVTICHATSSATNTYNRIVVSANAIGGHFNNPGSPKAGHEDDILLQGEQDCPTPPPSPNPPPAPPRGGGSSPSTDDTQNENSNALGGGTTKQLPQVGSDGK